jgi:hypothetical protein
MPSHPYLDGISPLWHKEVLSERELKMQSDELAIEDWETAKVKIRRQVSCRYATTNREG